MSPLPTGWSKLAIQKSTPNQKFQERFIGLIEQSMSGTHSLRHNTKYDSTPLLHD